MIGHAGPDRDAFLLILKSVIAATAGWVIANDLLGAPSATFAPFTALLMVQATLSQSLDQAARYAAAMVAGVVLAGFLTPLLGAATVTFAMLIMIALLLGRWRKLGQQGPQVGVAALFAYSSFTQSGGSPASFLQLASIAGLVLLGCALGIITNLLIVPPLRYRSAEYGLNSLARSMRDLLTDVAQGIEEGVPKRNHAEAWQHRANQFPDTVAQARSAVEHAAETMRFNPRRLLLRNSTSFEGHRTIINALERATEQLRSATRGLTYTTSTDHPREVEHDQFLTAYGQVLSAAAEAARCLGDLHSAEDTEHAEQLDDATNRARQAYQALVEQSKDQELDSPQQWPVYGALQTDAHRLVGEFIQAKQNLDQLMDTTEDDPTEKAVSTPA
ncbi:FUSC family protein [Saccharopolyspora sp. NPDC002578]